MGATTWAARQITYAELCEHNKETDLWILIDGKVYDVTKFLPEHPGGEEVLTTEAGKDATEPFEDVGHSDDARELIKKFYIGDLVDMENVPKKNRKLSDDMNTSSGSPPSIVIVIVVAAIAYFAYRYYSQKA